MDGEGEVSTAVMTETLLPYLQSYGIVSKGISPQNVKDSDFKELATKWKIKLIEPKTNRPYKIEQILKMLYGHTELLDMRRGGRRKAGLLNVPSFQSTADTGQQNAKPKNNFIQLNKNYFGLPPYALNRTAEGIVYQCRKPYDDDVEGSNSKKKEELNEENSENVHDQVGKLDGHKKIENHSAQRKVVAALRAMAGNNQMLSHFVFKGGIDAVVKLSYESTDSEVLAGCAECLLLSSTNLPHCNFLLEKQIMTVINCLIDNGDEYVKFICAKVFGQMTVQNGLESQLTQVGVMLPLQTLLSSLRLDTVCFSMICVCNLAPSMTGGDAEIAVRLCMLGCKRLDLVHDVEAAKFVSIIFNNLSRIPHYVSLLCEEGILPVLLTMLDCIHDSIVIANCSECIFNLSMLRKNRRDIAGSGISAQLMKIFDDKSPLTRSYMLLMTGNLLAAGIFLDKILRDDIIGKIINLLNKAGGKEQSVAAAYVISQLSHSESSAHIMVHECNIISKLIKLLSNKAEENLDDNTVNYLLTAVANLSHNTGFFLEMLKDSEFAVIICNEAASGEHQETICQVFVNISRHKELYDFIDSQLFGRLVLSIKTIFIRASTSAIKNVAIEIMINLAISIHQSRALLMDSDLVDILEEAGLDDGVLNHKFVTLLYLISCEAPLCPKLVDYGCQRLLMSVIGTMNNEEGKNVIAATLHNLSLKKALLGTGILNTLISFIKNCKTIRVLWATRTIANLSSYSRSRANLAKEPTLISCLTNIMRTGCEEADRVQHYCALAICNVLGAQVEKNILDDMIKHGTVVDLVVVTLLRVNSIATKEVLGKALFNLLSRGDLREQLVKLDLFEALIELGRIERYEVLELSVQTIYNISCETKLYAKLLEELAVPTLMISRATVNPELQGARATASVKQTCGMTLANMSFDSKLALMMTRDRIAEACNTFYKLASDETRYCACVILFNISFLENCTAVANTCAVPMLVSIIGSGPILCIQLAIGTLCNFSKYDVFHDQLTNVALGPMISCISAPHLDAGIKQDCVFGIHNMVTVYNPSQQKACEEGIVGALLKLIKIYDDEFSVGLLGRIVKEISSVDSMIKRLLTDGIMTIILKLSKYEYPQLKLDLACAMHSLSVATDCSLKFLKLDAVDILFWLTLHDCLGLYDPIRKYVSRTLRNISVSVEDACYLSKEERIFSVFRLLLKSTNDEVLWTSIVTIYNMLHPPNLAGVDVNEATTATKKLMAFAQDCKLTMVRRGVIQLIFDLAATGIENVRHLCSAALHCVADHIPDSDDPVVLQLIMCLLDAEGELFLHLSDKIRNDIPYTAPGAGILSTTFEHQSTGFTASWLPLSCEVDNLFQHSLILLKTSGSDQVATKPLNATVVAALTPTKLTGIEFNNFQKKSSNQNSVTEARDDGVDTEAIKKQSRMSSSNELVTSLSAPELSASPRIATVPRTSSKIFKDSSLSREGSWGSSEFLSQVKSADMSSTTAASILPSILTRATSRPSMPEDTVKALEGTHYKPKNKKMVLLNQSSFSKG